MRAAMAALKTQASTGGGYRSGRLPRRLGLHDLPHSTPRSGLVYPPNSEALRSAGKSP